jgi:protoporphyrinogen oxidase
LRNYVEKLWGCSGSEIDSSFVEILIDTVPKSPLMALVHSLKNVLTNRGSQRRNPTFMYPLGGTGALWTKLAAEVVRMGGQIHLNARVDRVIVRDMQVAGIDVDGRRVDLDFLISSLPLPVLHRAIFAESIPVIMPRSTVLVYLRLDGLEKFDGLWLYLIDAGIRCGRVTNVLAWQADQANRGKTDMLCLEYWCDSGDEIWMTADHEIAKLGESEMRAVGLVTESNVIGHHIERLNGTHPSFKKGHPKLALELASQLKNIGGLAMIGRHGSSSLGAMSDAMLDGVRIAKGFEASSI